MLMTITRSGTFAAQFTGDLSVKCDLAKVSVYTYLVEIQATDEHLSKEGFIIENSRIQHYFEDTYGRPSPAISCEMLARKSALDLEAMLEAENISITKVAVSVNGSNGAKLSAEWVKQ